MRVKLSLAVGAALIAGGSAVLVATPSATASITCPPGTIAKNVKLPTGGTIAVCVPGQQCDPGPCPSTAPPARD